DYLDEYIAVFQEVIGEYDSPRIYMQYTGLKDIKNKEIYEGDIVSYYPFKSEVGKVYYDEAETTYFIEPFDEDGEYEVLGLQCGVEIIGNIYENPELLEVK